MNPYDFLSKIATAKPVPKTAADLLAADRIKSRAVTSMFDAVKRYEELRLPTQQYLDSVRRSNDIIKNFSVAMSKTFVGGMMMQAKIDHIFRPVGQMQGKASGNASAKATLRAAEPEQKKSLDWKPKRGTGIPKQGNPIGFPKPYQKD